MNDNEIIKALECCATSTCFSGDCPIYDEDDGSSISKCTSLLSELALDLINRQQADKEALIAGQETLQKYIAKQQAEIERLQNLTEKDFEQTAISTVERHRKWIEYRAIKEFEEKAKHAIGLVNGFDYDCTGIFKIIDNLVKEMIGEV